LEEESDKSSYRTYYIQVTAYANDLTVGLGLIEDWNTLTNLLAKYKMVANTVVNKEKSKLLPLTEKTSQTILP
ncbi:13482_t:CDS:2, partial [Gigaspora rosea]